MSMLIAATAASLFGIGTYLVLQRKLSRIIIGLGLLTHGGNLLLITAGRRGSPPLIGTSDPAGFSDPLPQALALTAIVITFAVTTLLLAFAYRSFLLTDDDEVADVARASVLEEEIHDQEVAMTDGVAADPAR
jgi:multicomponent Na+:H+ antiporter subunit C